MGLKPRQVEAFRAVIEAGSVTAAARKLRISQPAVSKLVIELERAVSLTLFAREKRRLVPTPEARLFYDEIDRVYLGMERLERFAVDLRELKRGHVRIACLPSLGLHVVPRLIARFAADKPDARLTLDVQTTAKIADWMVAQQFDVGVSILSLDHPSVDVELLAKVDAVCVLPAGHPLVSRQRITPEDLKGMPFVALGHEDRFDQLIHHAFEDRSISRQISLATNLSEVACQFVAAGTGASIVDPFTAAQFGPHRIVAKPFHPPIKFDLYLLFPALRPRSLLLSEFVEALRAELKEFDELRPVLEG